VNRIRFLYAVGLRLEESHQTPIGIEVSGGLRHAAAPGDQSVTPEKRWYQAHVHGIYDRLMACLLHGASPARLTAWAIHI
jgi:hypothetical protein